MTADDIMQCNFLIEAARADERRLERARAERDIAAWSTERWGNCIDDVLGQGWVAALLASDYPKADPEPAPALPCRRYNADGSWTAIAPDPDSVDEPAPAPVEWVDGKATVGGCVLWAAKSEDGITGIEVDDMKPDGGDAYITHPDEATAKRLAIAVARALAETGRTP